MMVTGGSVQALLLAAAAQAAASDLPNPRNPDYVYCEDFETGREKTGALPVFSIAGRHGIREGAGYRSKYGYSNVLVENHGIPPYPEIRFPRQDGIVFVHYMLKAPANFYLGRANHGYYLYDSKQRSPWGSAVMDHATDHPAWLDPEWDPHTINVLRGSGYHRMTRSFEGFEPRRRGEWHSHQVMIVPSKKDPSVGRMKVWIDGDLANFCKHDTIPSCDTFWISNYWHSMEYVPKDTVSNLFESNTAPPHPAFEIFLDNLIISRSLVEVGPNRPQIERVRFSDLRPGSFTANFDTTVAARRVRAEWGEPSPPGAGNGRERARRLEADAAAPGYFHSLRIEGLQPENTYTLRLGAADARGRAIQSPPVRLTTVAGGLPAFHIGESGTVDSAGEHGPWKGEVFQNLDFSGIPVCVRAFNSLSYVAWPGPDSDDLVDTSKPMSVRYTRTSTFTAGTYVFRVQAYDGVRVIVDGAEKLKDVRRTGGHNARKDFRLPLAGGPHTVIVEHSIWREDNWEKSSSKHLSFKIVPDDTEPPACLAQAIYSTRFHKPEEPAYCGRWSEEVQATVEFGETDRYGRSATGSGRYPYIRLGKLEVGKTYHWRVTAADSLGNRTVTPDEVFTCGDTLPPQKTLCRLERVSDTRLMLKFRAPGEDGRHGTASEYDVRWSADPLTAAGWDKATKIDGVPRPRPAPSEESLILDGFPRGKTFYVAVKAIDQAGQAGLMSNVVSDPPGPEVMDCDGDGYGVGSLKGPDPDDYDRAVPGSGRR